MSDTGHSLLPQSAIDSGAAWDRAMRDGDFSAAWAVSDRVLAGRDPALRDDPARPYHERWVWDGRPLAGRDVLVRCYHGLGDTLQFVRFLAPLRALAASVTVEIQPELLPLLMPGGGAVRFIPFDPGHPTPSECDIEIMELCHALRLASPPPVRVAVAPARLGPGPHIGVCWAVGAWEAGRSLPLDLLRPLAAYGTLVSLQRGPAAIGAGLFDPAQGSIDVLETARVIRALDLVVTVDTMVAHLAGAVGTPTAVLLPAEADWRWGRGATSPWYPAHRLFRQIRPGAWERPVQDLLTQLSLPGNPGAGAGFVAKTD